MESTTSCEEEKMENSEINNDLSELNELGEGIVVWAANQATLEEQALKELEILAEENKQLPQTDLEDGEIEEEICDSETVPKVKTQRKEAVLDINTYIKRQEELRKRQEYSKSLKASCYQKEKKLADEISKRELKKGKRRVKKVKIDEKKENTIENASRSPEASCSSDYNEFPERNLRKSQQDRLQPENIDSEREIESGSEYFPSDDEFCAEDVKDFDMQATEEENSLLINRKRKKRSLSQTIQISKIKDDGCLSDYQARLNIYYEKLEKELESKASRINNNASAVEDETDFQLLKKGLKVPKNVWERLYTYQQDGIEWLWNLHLKPTGGILGDEMGLGKTVQVIAFLHALEFSKIVSGRFIGVGPSLLVCPVTVIHQWVQHFHEWAPEFRVAVLHQSGSFQGNKLNLIKEINKKAGILITTYSGILKYKGNLLEHYWHYIILDEGHKIRNPTAKVSIAVKELRTPHRIMLTGSPMQNNLTELWSLFDFTNPGMLGGLNTFQEHFIHPILQGGFTNASAMQEATALSVASTLKKIIDPYLLRRSKSEVQGDIYLPSKTEQVLFCSLTQEQKDLYKGYLMSDHVNTILGRGINKHWYSENHVRANVLVAITNLRKICNHPDLYLHDNDENFQLNEAAPLEERFGYYKRCGKMIVVSALLKIWKKQGHRVLLFSQGRAMIAVFQDFLEQNGYKYLKMDGSTSISSRQPLIDKFNQDGSYDVFLLTTRVGGLGVNLTGANRVIIYDPDWNPATDTQARERAWRIGQDKQVTIYRLLSAGTVEEKMYQRQVWKQLLSNKVLIDPKTHRFFKSSDLYDLFSLQECDANPETANIFHDSRVKLQENYKRKRKSKIDNKNSDKVVFSEDKIKAMKEMAQKIAKALSTDNPSSSSSSIEKTDDQLQLEKEREEKRKQKEELKKLSAPELIVYNRNKAEAKDEGLKVNSVNDQETSVSFSQALELSLNPPTQTVEVSKEVEEAPKEIEDQAKKGKRKKTVKVDTSGKIDGEQVEGLIKCETRKRKLNDDELEGAHNNYVLEKLFAKKGVSGALQHDSIVESGPRLQSLKVRTEAEQRADKALEALRKSRLDSWRW